MSVDLVLGEALGAFLLGLASAPHCVAMCGGISSALGMSAVSGNAVALNRGTVILNYSLGRISGYALMGAFAGFLGYTMSHLAMEFGIILRGAAGVMMILLGLYVAGWSTFIRRFEAAGFRLWQLTAGQKRGIDLSHPWQQYLSGIAWGWLPCGVVYSVLALALAVSDPLGSALVMICFGLGTLPAVAGTGFAAAHLVPILSDSRIKAGIGIGMILFGIWTLGFVLMMARGHAM